MQVEPTWISTCEHIQRVSTIYQQSSKVDRLLKRYKLPSDFPYTSFSMGLFSSRIPLAIIANGAMEVNYRHLVFQARPMLMPGATLHQLQKNLVFTLDASEIVQIERYHAASPFASQYDLLFSRIYTHRSGLLTDFLVCVGGIGPQVEHIRKQSNQLFLMLRKAIFTE